MSKTDPERVALIERIKIAAEALDIPADAVADVLKHGTNPRTNKSCRVLCAFGVEHSITLDWLMAGDIGALIKYAAIGYKITMRSAA